MSNEKLITAAIKAKDKAYAPYSTFRVGAAALMENGDIYQGANIENSSYSLTCCAERIAIFNAISNGNVQFAKFAVVADTEEPISPCGACRQVMAEFFNDQVDIFLVNKNGLVKRKTISQLLPYSFSLEEKRD